MIRKFWSSKHPLSRMYVKRILNNEAKWDQFATNMKQYTSSYFVEGTKGKFLWWLIKFSISFLKLKPQPCALGIMSMIKMQRRNVTERFGWEQEISPLTQQISFVNLCLIYIYFSYQHLMAVLCVYDIKEEDLWTEKS